MNQTSQETAAEFVRLFDSLIATTAVAINDAQAYRKRYLQQGDRLNARRWDKISRELKETQATNERKRANYLVHAGEHYDVPTFLRQAE